MGFYGAAQIDKWRNANEKEMSGNWMDWDGCTWEKVKLEMEEEKKEEEEEEEEEEDLVWTVEAGGCGVDLGTPQRHRLTNIQCSSGSWCFFFGISHLMIFASWMQVDAIIIIIKLNGILLGPVWTTLTTVADVPCRRRISGNLRWLFHFNFSAQTFETAQSKSADGERPVVIATKLQTKFRSQFQMESEPVDISIKCGTRIRSITLITRWWRWYLIHNRTEWSNRNPFCVRGSNQINKSRSAGISCHSS